MVVVELVSMAVLVLRLVCSIGAACQGYDYTDYTYSGYTHSGYTYSGYTNSGHTCAGSW